MRNFPLLPLAVLAPIAIYLFVLAQLNRRPRATLVSGPWDFAGILFAASGFLFVGGPALLSTLTLSSAWRRFWIFARGSSGLDNDDLLLTVRIVLFVVYFVVVVGVAGLLLWRRRGQTAIYNVDPAVVEVVLGQVLQRWQVPFVQAGNVLKFEPETAIPAPPPELAQGITGEQTLLMPALVDRPTKLEVDVSLRMYHVTLTWDPPDCLLRREVEAQLERHLAESSSPSNGVGDWLMLLAGGLGFLLLGWLIVLVMYWIFRP